ncbi:hypothetical protein [Lichenifustis flavocetrariae]|uniref:Uncharacterized protein n=1 Tax=Lichenifustis flavocetrariae TaxID=2949735 RepID=A0AA41Z065_9HYPH|nr:hypothetical protein [Lichenifustis flavocetrariae]MCW6511349.1 hypothetical protein [Lichenifustis flavocetrariae]
MAAFSHPLARKAKVWSSVAAGKKSHGVLVIVTTLALDPKSKKFKAEKVERLSTVATEWLSFNQDKASEFVLVNRTRDW